MGRDSMKKGLRVLLAPCFFSFALAAFADAPQPRRVEPAWERALGGDAAAAPAVFRDRVFVLSVDRSIACLDETGRFLWRKPLKNRPAARLTVSRNGLVCVFGRNGEMSAFSSNGVDLWTYSGKRGSLPVLDPHEGRDGRLFILYEDEIICLAANGTQKWRSKINGLDAVMISEDGRGNALVIRSGGEVTPVSPWGTVFSSVKTGFNVKSAVPLAGNACALFVPENASSWKIAALDFNPARNREDLSAPDILWEKGGFPPLAAALCRGGTLYYAGTDGRLFMLNATDGSPLSQAEIRAQGGISGASMFFSPDESAGRIILLAQEMCAAFSEGGEILWQVEFSKPLLNPVFTEGGFVVSSPQDTIISAFRAELSVGRKSSGASESRRDNYGIFSGKSRDYGNPETVSFYYFEEVKKKIEAGNLGRDELDISRRLAEILNGDTGNPFSPVQYGAYQRSLATSLLGQMGSEEAREVLLYAARRETDPTVAAGILRGLASLGPESGQETFDAVLFILQRQRRTEDIALAACEALYSLARSSCGETPGEAAAAIFSYTGEQYSPAVQKYAAQLLEKLIE